MSTRKRAWTREIEHHKQLKLWSMVLVVYFVAIILYILASKDTNDQKERRFSRLKPDSLRTAATASSR